MTGAPWPFLGGAAPRAVMAPDRDRDDGWDVDAFVQHHIVRCKFNAVHRPLQMLLPNANDRRLCELADQVGFGVLTWMYGDVGGGTAPPDALGSGPNKAHQQAVLEFYRPYKNVVMGLGYDNREWVADNEGNRWYRRLKALDPSRQFCIRARLDEPRRDPDDGMQQRLGYRPGDIASFEVQLIDPFGVDDMIDAAHSPVFPGEPHIDRPVINAERIRVGTRPKDVTFHEIPVVIILYREANVGCIYGNSNVIVPNWRWPAELIPRIIAANTGEAPGPVPEEEDDMRIKLSNHRWRRIKIAPKGIADPSKNRPGRSTTEFIWKDEHWFEAPLGNELPWSVHMIDGFDGALRGWAEEYLISIEIHDGSKWHRVLTARPEKEGRTDSVAGVSASTGPSWFPIQLFRAYEIPANSKWRIKVKHNIAGNTPHVEIDLHAEEL